MHVQLFKFSSLADGKVEIEGDAPFPQNGSRRSLQMCLVLLRMEGNPQYESLSTNLNHHFHVVHNQFVRKIRNI